RRVPARVLPDFAHRPCPVVELHGARGLHRRPGGCGNMIDPGLIALILIGGLVLLLAIGAPVSISIALPSAICMMLIINFDNGAITSAQQMFRGANSFALLAIPFFILAGVIMNNG